jgi:DNA repair protein RecO (recombination protein O)
MITKTKAIVLKAARFRDTSKIITLYTEKFGKLKGLAKGARTLKSKFGAALEPITEISLVVYKQDTRDLHLISQADVLNSYKKTHQDFDKMSISLSVLELLSQLAHDEDKNKSLYELVRLTLKGIDSAERNLKNYFYAFQLHLSANLGFAPNFDNCVQCNQKLEMSGFKSKIIFQISKGGFYCSNCADKVSAVNYTAAEYGRTQNISMSLVVGKTLRLLYNFNLDGLPSLFLLPAIGNEITNIVRLFLKYHFSDLRPLKSESLMMSIHQIK